MKNGLGLVGQLEDQRLLRADGAQVQVLDVWEEAAFHLQAQKKYKWDLNIWKEFQGFRSYLLWAAPLRS